MNGVLVVLLVATAADSTARPRVVERVEAEVPVWARGTGLSTRVTLRVLVGRDGRAQRIEVVPYATRRDVLTRDLRAGFDSAAVRAVRRWRFEPARSAGRPVAAWLTVEVPVEEAWIRADDGTMPDSIRSPELWNALMGEWGRRPGRPSPMRRPAALLFRRGGHYVERDSVQRERAGRFEVSSNVDAEPGGWLTRRPEGASRRIDRVRFAGPDTLILCGATAGGACDTFVATRRGPAR